MLVLAACSSSSPHASPTATLPPTATVATIPDSPGVIRYPSGPTGCSQSDLGGPGLQMPAPRVITTQVVMKGGGGYGARLEPTPGAKPAVSAATAWLRMTHDNPLRARSGELMLGRFRASVPFGPHGPQKYDVIAWVVQLHHLAYAYPPDPSRAAVCIFTDAYLVIDATTGADVLDAY